MDASRYEERIRILGRALPPDLGAALPALRERTRALEHEALRLYTMLEVAYLAAAADGELVDAEIHTLAANLDAWLHGELAPGLLVEIFHDFGTLLAEHGFAGRLAAAAKVLDPASQRTAYTLACVTALIDFDVREEELGFLGQIADAFGIPEDEAQARFDELDATVTALARS